MYVCVPRNVQRNDKVYIRLEITAECVWQHCVVIMKRANYYNHSLRTALILCHNTKLEGKWRPLRPAVSELTAVIRLRTLTST